jgi:hypothetical protein
MPHSQPRTQPVSRPNQALLAALGRTEWSGNTPNAGERRMDCRKTVKAARQILNRAARIVCWFVLATALPSVSLADGRGPVRSLLEMRQDHVVVQQWDLSCGAAAVATLLNYQHGDPVSEREIAKGLIQGEKYFAEPLLVRARHGSSLLDLKRYVTAVTIKASGTGSSPSRI